MNNRNRWIWSAGLVLGIILGGYALFQSKEQRQRHWGFSSGSTLSFGSSNPQKVLGLLELTNQKNKLHSDWYALISPLEYVVANGLIQSVIGYLFWDLERPLQVALRWEEKHPLLLVILPSDQGLQAAENLSRQLQKFGRIEKSEFQWHGTLDLPRLPQSTISWEAYPKYLLFSWSFYRSPLFSNNRTIECQ